MSSETQAAQATDAPPQPFVPKVETQNQKNKRLAREAAEAEAARVAELKRQEEAARKEEQERQRVEKERLDRLDRRAGRVEKCLHKFVIAHSALLESMKVVTGQKKEVVKKSKKEKEKEKSMKRKPPSPVQASWMELLTELDSKINETKSCGLDDILPGYLKLTPEEQMKLVGIVESINKKSLPKGRDLKDTQSVIHKCLVQAVFSEVYRKPKVGYAPK
eukprot:CAMPEP_0117683388 /NCGR_PEP_ID=MMETSP0804-20121206/20362_1 /TAXON_ID=1074897 /ORGANISM="Tetraselmis astigmatica, Strain CCMP880" /LENGTH=218 /DNA_ID=CAMNT_0005493955 /DNA_START=240 /DNA_END=896 /DNA_ORIENTATION=-